MKNHLVKFTVHQPSHEVGKTCSMFRISRCSNVHLFFLLSLSSLALLLILSDVNYYNWPELNLAKLFKNTKLEMDNSNSEYETYSKNSAFIIDTPGCKIPKFDPYDRTVFHLFAIKSPHICPGKPLFLSTHPNGSITVNETTLNFFYNLTLHSISCTYQGIRRLHEKPGNTRENDYSFGNTTQLAFGKPLKDDHVVVHCDLGHDNLTQFIPIPRLIQKVEGEKSTKKPFTPHLNAILVGIDSISKLNFLRHFKETRQFMKQKLTPFDMKGYMKLGDNTFPNLICLLSGRFPQEVWNETVQNTMFFDDVDFIWKRYAAKGYRTLFAEDMPHVGTFNYGKRGFDDQPTDYYYRPLSLAIRQSELYSKSKDYCLNSQTESDIIFDYLKDFVRIMGSRPYFAYVMISSMTHDYFNQAAYVDRSSAHLLEYLWDSGALNDSVLVFYSDHGIRFGGIRKTYIGKFEERMPFMYIHFPSWFLRQYPEYNSNLIQNQDRLMTLFDVHSTLLHLLEPHQQLSDEVKASSTPYGTSLLNEISKYRTCEKAGIMDPWCVCQTFYDESPTATIVVKSAAAIVNLINEKLIPHNSTCTRLEVKTITNAKYGQISDLVLRFVRHENVVIDRYVVYDKRIDTYVDYVVTFATIPGNARFEGTVRLDTKNDVYEVLFVKRTNLYATECILDMIGKICYCI